MKFKIIIKFIDTYLNEKYKCPNIKKDKLIFTEIKQDIYLKNYYYNPFLRKITSEIIEFKINIRKMPGYYGYIKFF